MRKLIMGDCRAVVPTLGLDPRRTVVLTDPPYGDAHDTDYTRFGGGNCFRGDKPRGTFRRVVGDAAPFDPAPWLRYSRVVLWGANRYSDRLPCGSWLVWDKRAPSGSKGVMSDAEVAWDSHGRGVYLFEHFWDGFNRQSERGSAHRFHPTQKPVALMEWVLRRMNLLPDVTVLDPYAGSGPVGVACARLGLSYVGIEVDPTYHAIAARRVSEAEAEPLLDLEVNA